MRDEERSLPADVMWSQEGAKVDDTDDDIRASLSMDTEPIPEIGNFHF